MKKIIQKGTYAILVQETLSDASFVFNVRLYPNPPFKQDGIELLAKDENTAQELFNKIEESCVGITDC